MRSFPRIRRLLGEPLLHFLLLGFGLFLVYGWIGAPANGEGGKVVITQARIEQLAAGFVRMNQRLPDKAELDGLIEDSIREEIYYREAKLLGLDQDDTIVRRRLRQKLEFVSEDVTPVPEPTDAQLQAYLQLHPEHFQAEREYSLDQIYLDPRRHGAHLGSDARRLLADLRRQGPAVVAGMHGDAFLLGRHFENASASELARVFGMKFEAALRTAPIGQWAGPIPSGYGMHMVLVGERRADRAASLGEVRDAVRRAWVEARRVEANARFYADLRRRYEVTVEHPAASPGTGMVAGLPP